MIRKSWITTLAIALLMAFGAILSNCSTDKQYAETRTAAAGRRSASGLAGAQVGNHAPDFQLVRTDGSPVSLADMRGKPAVIVFWSAWCSSCKEEAPRINALAAEYERKGVRVLGIDIKDSAARTESGIREFGIRYAVARDPDASVAHAYQVTGTPTIVFLDREGVVRYFANELPDDYARRLDGLLAGII
ncbi:MAG TPA: TlpA disulfide reductase family protein [Blastocatellia bacterium]|nr:TlpA disulfide reductase family protein [Blastocatellia bacterium]